MEIVGVLGVGVILFLLLREKGGGKCDACEVAPLQGAAVNFLQSSTSPAGSQPASPRPQKTILFGQDRIRPDGPLKIFPVSNNGQGVTTQTRIRKTQ